MAFGGVQVPRTLLCVNVSHVAVLRAAQGGSGPDPVAAAATCAKAGCNSVAVRLREDRRLIKDEDVFAIRKAIPVNGKFYIETSLSGEMIDLARKVRPSRVTIVPEKKEEMTEQGAFDVGKSVDRIRDAVEVLHDQDIQVSLFVEPDIETIELSKECGADFVEFHTGAYAAAADRAEIDRQIELIHKAAEHASNIRIKTNAGSGLDYRNVVPLFHARELLELNIGRAIILRSDSIGLWKAVEEMMEVLD